MHERVRRGLIRSVLLLTPSACASETPPPPPPPAEVGVVDVQPEHVVLREELPGRIAPFRMAQVRARVAGVVLKRSFAEGSEVKQGQPLFVIDPAPLKAEMDGANATLARGLATLNQAESQKKRTAELLDGNSVSVELYETTVAAEATARADVAQARAALMRARLNLGYATVTAPISGKIGGELVTEGALVGQNEATPLAVIQQIDPVYVDIKQPASQLMRLRRAVPESARQGEATATLVLDDGSEFPQKGKVLFSDINVDPGTGEVTLRTSFPNPDRTLLPGMFARVKLDGRVYPEALMVPQQAVARDSGGGTTVLVVDPEGKLEARPVRVGGVDRDRYIVEEGLKAGDRVVVDGQQKVTPGAVVRAVPWTAGKTATARD
ncbi:efflux RND transporter periplasmic adaptor subunit [Chondromyces crocatus]|uniref:MexE family multidrug efflux RND transporter periplasmic adaptor subunit n=1 Tax=Chondromyces crocatus TaxID=52 RepID=A0A0K1EU89_CHOCO|nr:efflux RND transporter periplasmic adaptor subunit [Chondromyces crocatus]AKT44193.1 MexE family multidrug efflux RND transporter periplasmic adaptor subunit [Chondromyces crocatus]